MSFHFAVPFDTRNLKSQHKAGINLKDEKSLANRIKKLRQKSQAVQAQLAHTKEVQDNGSTDYFDLPTKHNQENIVQMAEEKISKAEEKLFSMRTIQKNKGGQKRKGESS